MPITAKDIDQRLQGLLKIVEEQGAKLIKTKDGKTLEESLKELKEENEKLKKENEDLKKNFITLEELERRFEGKFDKNGIFKGSSGGSQQGGTSGSGGESEEEKA